MGISKKLLNKPLEMKWCNSCDSFKEHVGGTLCVGCVLTDEEVEWYINNVESQMEASEEKKTPEPPKPLSGVEEGDRIYLSDGTEAVVSGTTSRSVKASGRSFVKSDGTGWGSNELDAAPFTQA